MRKVVLAGLALVIMVAFAFLMTSRVAAQRGGRVVPPVITAPFLPLEGPGSSIGATVVDQGPGEAAGVRIDSVQEGTAATRAGLQKGDVVVEFDGERTRSARQFTRLVRETPPGRAVRMTVLRDGSKRTLDITPELRSDQTQWQFPQVSADVERAYRAIPRDFRFDQFFGEGQFGSSRRLGVAVSPLSDQLAAYFGVKDGVLISEILQNTPAASADLKAGDVITAVNGRSVLSPSDLSQEVRAAQPGSTLDLRLTRNRKEVTVKVMLQDQRRPAAPGTQPI